MLVCGSFNEHENIDNVKINCSGVNGFVLKCNSQYNPVWGFASGDKINGLVECMHIDKAGNNYVGVNRPRNQGVREQAVYIAKIDKDAHLV